MNRSQKRAKRMRARQHQQELKSTTKTLFFDKKGRRVDSPTADKGLTTVEVPRGPQPSSAYHKTSRPKHGRRLDARGLAIAELAEIGIVDPEPSLITEYQRLKRAVNGSKPIAQSQVQDAVKAMNAGLRRAAQAAKAIKDAKPGQQVVANEDGIRIEDKTSNHIKVDILATKEIEEELAQRENGHISEEQWAELEAQAKKLRKGRKGFERVLGKAGYELISDGHDHRERESWVAA